MLEKANVILSLFTPERPELAVLEIAHRLGRPRSSVYRILAKMADTGFLDQDPVSGRYRVGIRLANLGELARHSSSLQRVSYPRLCRLGEVTGEMVTLMVLSGREGVTIDAIESFHPLKIPGHLGGRFPLHATAGGKVLLAWRSEAELRELIVPPLARCTRETITNPARLRRELDITRNRGYGTSAEEWLETVCAVGAPVKDHRGKVVAAVATACPVARWNRKTIATMATVVQETGKEISAALGYQD